MISILIVDDDLNKISKISCVISQVLDKSQCILDTASDVVSAKNLIAEKFYDLLIVDLVLPVRPGEHPVDHSGSDFILEIPHIHAWNKPGTIIGITAFDEAFETQRTRFEDGLWYLLKYDPSSIEWEAKLKSRLAYLLHSQSHGLIGSESGYKYDLAIVSALFTPELVSILPILSNQEELISSLDETIYYAGELQGSNRKLKVVAACAKQMGMIASCALTMKCIENFRPRFVILTGITAGFKSSKVGIGDILICDESWNCDSGKRVFIDGKSKFQPDPKHISIAGSLFSKLQKIVGDQQFMSLIQRDWFTAQDHPLKSHLGPVVSGSSVISDSSISQEIKSHARTVLGLEMETYGVYYAALNCTNPKPLALSIKSVCDYADEGKSDDHQEAASTVSAEYLRHLASTGIFD